MKHLFAFLCLFTFLFASQSMAAEKLPVMVSVVPQKFIAERIGGEHVDVTVMVLPGASPATYEPKPKQMRALSKASMYIAIGAPFEKAWLPRIASANSDMKIVHMDKGVQKIPMAKHTHHEEEGLQGDNDGNHNGHAKHEEHHDHDMHAKHDDEHHEHRQAGHQVQKTSMHHDDEEILDPHVWLSPMLVKHMAETVKKAFVRADPANAVTYRKNYRTLVQEIETLDMEIFNIFAPIPEEKRVFMVFHPSWGYFAMNYQLQQIPIEYEGKHPTPKILQTMVEEANENNIRTIFVQPQFSRKSAETIARHINANVVVADPLAEDWMNNLRTTAKNLAASFSK